MHEHELADEVEVRPEPVHERQDPGRPAVGVHHDVASVDLGDMERALAAVRPDEVGDEGIGRMREDLGGRGGLRDPAAALQDDDLVAEQERLVDVVRHEHHRLPELALQPEELLLQLRADDRVDGAEGLVHQEDVRVDRQSAGDADALLLAARELARVAIGEGPVQPDGVEQLEGVRVRLALPGPAEQRHGGHVVDHLAVRQEAGVLHDVPDSASQLHRILRRDVRAVDEHLPAGRVDHAVDHAEQRRLAGAR